tara:strand:+ start:127 stop:258 length:132 start_codon:yes stop_codon:yes gene_type:complete
VGGGGAGGERGAALGGGRAGGSKEWVSEALRSLTPAPFFQIRI